MRLRADLELGGAYAYARAGRHVLRAQIEFNIKLIAGERPAVAALRERRDEPRVDDGELIRAPPLTERPTIPDETFLDVERCGVEHLALARTRPAHDQRQNAALAWRALDLGQRRLEFRIARVTHGHWLADAAARPRCRSMIPKMSVCRTAAGTSFAAAP